jgi:hypothetical protein
LVNLVIKTHRKIETSKHQKTIHYSLKTIHYYKALLSGAKVHIKDEKNEGKIQLGSCFGEIHQLR